MTNEDKHKIGKINCFDLYNNPKYLLGTHDVNFSFVINKMNKKLI